MQQQFFHWKCPDVQTYNTYILICLSTVSSTCYSNGLFAAPSYINYINVKNKTGKKMVRKAAWACPLDVENRCTSYPRYLCARARPMLMWVYSASAEKFPWSEWLCLLFFLFHLIRIDRSALGICYNTYQRENLLEIQHIVSTAILFHDSVYVWHCHTLYRFMRIQSPPLKNPRKQ